MDDTGWIFNCSKLSGQSVKKGTAYRRNRKGSRAEEKSHHSRDISGE